MGAGAGGAQTTYTAASSTISLAVRDGGVNLGGVTLTAPGVTRDAEQHTDIAYATSSPSQRLDLYLPKRTGPAVPLVIFVHGGAFPGGDKHDAFATQEFLDRGFAVASVTYRLSGEAPFPSRSQPSMAATAPREWWRAWS